MHLTEFYFPRLQSAIAVLLVPSDPTTLKGQLICAGAPISRGADWTPLRREGVLKVDERDLILRQAGNEFRVCFDRASVDAGEVAVDNSNSVRLTSTSVRLTRCKCTNMSFDSGPNIGWAISQGSASSWAEGEFRRLN